MNRFLEPHRTSIVRLHARRQQPGQRPASAVKDPLEAPRRELRPLGAATIEAVAVAKKQVAERRRELEAHVRKLETIIAAGGSDAPRARVQRGITLATIKKVEEQAEALDGSAAVFALIASIRAKRRDLDAALRAPRHERLALLDSLDRALTATVTALHEERRPRLVELVVLSGVEKDEAEAEALLLQGYAPFTASAERRCRLASMRKRRNEA